MAKKVRPSPLFDSYCRSEAVAPDDVVQVWFRFVIEEYHSYFVSVLLIGVSPLIFASPLGEFPELVLCLCVYLCWEIL